MKKLVSLLMVVLMLVVCFAGCSKTPIGHEELLERVKDADAVEETEKWVMESKSLASSDKAIQRVYESVKIDGTPLMYIGYQINPNGIDYAFTVQDDQEVKHLYILRQTTNKKVSILKETTDFDLFDYFTN